MGHRARSTAEDYRTSLVDPLVEKKYTLFSECMRTYSPDYVIFILRMYGAILSFKVFLRVFRHKERRTLNCFGGWHQ